MTDQIGWRSPALGQAREIALKPGRLRYFESGKGKTIVLIHFATQLTRRKCPAGTSRVTATGTVTGGSGAAAAIIKKGEPFNSSVCAYTSGANAGKTQNEPGTKITM